MPTLVGGGQTIPDIRCKDCDRDANNPRGGGGRFTLQCPKCQQRVFVFTSATAPMLIIWRKECPKGLEFYDYVRQRMGERKNEYVVNQPRTGTIEAPDYRPAAAPG